MMSFVDALTITLYLTISGKAYTVPGGNVKTLELDLRTYGFSGTLSFVVSTEHSTDSLLSSFTQNDLIEVSLEVAAFQQPSDAKSNPLKLNGLVTKKGFSEKTLTNVLPTQELMLYRHYHLSFADPAQVLWKQHYPCDLLTDTTLKALITAHTNEKITLEYDWDTLTTEYSMLALSLGATGKHASFYDYLIWLVDSQNGVFTYDLANNQYSLKASKSQSGTTQSLNPFEVANYGIEFPEIGRFEPNVLNAYSENPQTTTITNEQKASPIRRDYIARYPIASQMESRVTLETARFKQRMHEVWMEYQQFPLFVTPPGQLVDFNGSGWSSSIYVSGYSYRVREWRLIARSAEENLILDYNMPYSRYVMEHSMRLEKSDESWVDLPAYTIPLYPFFVEGKIVSNQGEDTDATYEVSEDEDTSSNYYTISIPLWDDKNVRADYQPNLLTGQFYFPPYKNARVLVGLDFDSAHIVRFLDWGSGTALPMDSQGNQLVMGKSTTNQTIFKHSYVDEKPQLLIQRTLDSDTQLLQFSDGTILLQTQQEEES